MAQSGQVITFSATGQKETEDVSNIELVTIREMTGGDGGGGTAGRGGKIINAEFDVSSTSSLSLFVGEFAAGSSGGFGRSNGGDGADPSSTTAGAGGGGGSTEILADGVFIAAADGGGGNGQNNSNQTPDGGGGGGGARGGAGGQGKQSSLDGEDAQGFGFGGTGGDFPDGDGQSGGAELGAASLLPNGSKTDNNNRPPPVNVSTDGKIKLAFDVPFRPSLDSVTEDTTGVDPAVTLDFTNFDGRQRENEVFRSTASSASFPTDFTPVGTAPQGQTVFTDSPPDFDQNFTYRVTSSINGGTSEPSNPLSITTSSEGQLIISITGTNTPVETRSGLTLNAEVENIGDYRANETLDVDLEPQ
jgi:hypothetical protein